MTQRPFWTFLPYINNRTAWKPIRFPAILVVPFGANSDGLPLAQSSPLGIRVSILDTIRRNRVTGPFEPNVFFPNRELFTLSLNSVEIAARQLDINDFEIDGDILKVINSDGLMGEVPYIPDSLYYDFSDVAIGVENLDSGRYQLSYNAVISGRIYDSNDFLICINDDTTDSILRYVDFVHPGEVIDEMKKTTPSIWFSNQKLADEQLTTLYKPLSDSLQNVYDEQSLMGRVNFVNEVFPETVPYLGRMLGWEVPYFPRSLDPLRRSVLRTTTDFQKMRGTYKGIKELFDLFGFEILIRNLWFDHDNETLLEPQYQSQNGIELFDTIQFDLLETDLRAPGFYTNEIQLRKRPAIASEFDNFIQIGSDVTIEAYVAEVGTPAHQTLLDYSAQYEASNTANMRETEQGFINDDLLVFTQGQNFLATQIINLNSDGDLVSESQTGLRRIISTEQVEVDPIKPATSLALDGHWPDENVSIFIFASYRSQIVVPNLQLEDRRSNFFDVRLSNTVDANTPISIILDYALEFLYRIKAFHSLLRRIFITLEATEVYLVGDYCYGLGLSRQATTDIGQQQVPPAIIPEGELDVCTQQDARLLGYKESDIVYRDRVTAGLIEEWTTYTGYDSRPYNPVGLDFIPQFPNISREIGDYNEYGQDAYVGEYQVTRAFRIETPSLFVNQNLQAKPIQYFGYNTGGVNAENRCTGFRHSDVLEFYTAYTPAPNLQVRQPICFKGRVNDELALYLSVPLEEPFVLGACRIKMGFGSYFTTPRQSVIVRGGAADRCIGSLTPKPIISSCREVSGERFDEMWVGEQGRVGVDPIRLNGTTDSVLHFWDRPEPLDAGWESAANRVTTLGIQRTNMHFPGTRFIGMGNYDGTFISSVYNLRPWDQGICNQTLNPTIEIRTDGNEYLVFDNRAFTFEGNGVESDLPQMGSPTVSPIVDTDVVQAIYSQYADADCPGLCPWDTNIASNDGVFDVPDLGGTAGVTTADALFRSVRDCGGTLVDFADGYPCIVGPQAATPDVGGLFYLLGSTSPLPASYLFFMNSGIRDGSRGLRLDCDCLAAPCGPTDPEPTCDISETPDNLVVESRLVLPEQVPVCEFLMDGTIPSMFELIEN